MRLKTLALLVVAVGCGLVAMLGVQQVLSNNSAGADQKDMVLTATTEVLPGTPLDDKNVEFKEWPRGSVPEGAIVKKEQFADRTLKVRAFPGDVITESKLNQKGVRSVSSDVPKGMRMVSLPIDPTMTGTGLIRPGDKVDVLVTYKSGGRDVGGIGKEVKTVLECIEVFAVDAIRDATLMPAANDPKAAATTVKHVSLVVNPEQASLLKLADDVGDIHLTLRGLHDDSRVDPKELFDPRQAEQAVADRNLKSERDHATTVIPPVVAPPVAAPKKWKIEIITGKERRVEEVDLPDETVNAKASDGAVPPSNSKS